MDIGNAAVMLSNKLARCIKETLGKGIIYAVAIVPLLSSSAPALAASTLSVGYLSAKPLDGGEIVSLDKNPGIVVAADTTNADSMVGIIIGPNDALLSLTSSPSEVQVATSGVVDTLVSTANGDVKAGDKITASPIAGVGTKATNSTRVIGVAEASLDAKTPGASKQTVKDKSGKNKDVYVAKIPVQIGITFFSTGSTTPNPVPSFLQKFANAVASKQVQPLPIVISGFVLLVTFLTAGIIMYSAIRSSIISVGRNPLAKGGVLSGLIQVIIIDTLLIAAGMATIYFILRLV